MAQQTDNLRERLLATLPPPENLAAYREQTTALLGKHERAVRTDERAKNMLYACLAALLLVGILSNRWLHLDLFTVHLFQFLAAVFWFAAALNDVRYRIYKSQVAALKEIKQVQLQILELQASLRKSD